jgi:hypothetical protein
VHALGGRGNWWRVVKMTVNNVCHVAWFNFGTNVPYKIKSATNKSDLSDISDK